MPYPQTIRGRHYNKRITKNGYYITKNRAQLAAARRRVLGMGNKGRFTEVKYWDFTTAAQVAGGDTGWVNLGTAENPIPLQGSNFVPTNTLFAPNTGNALYERTGRRAWLKYIKIDGTIQTAINNDSIGDWNDNRASYIRMVLFEDTQTNGGLPDFDEVFQKSYGTGIIGDSAAADSELVKGQSFLNSKHFGRYRILKDKRIYPALQFGSAQGVINANAKAEKDIRFKMKWKPRSPRLVNYQDNVVSGDTGNIQNNAFYLMCYYATNQDVTGDSFLNVNLNGRTAFYDHKT